MDRYDIQMMAMGKNAFDLGRMMQKYGYVLNYTMEPELSEDKYFIDGTVEGSRGNEYGVWVEYNERNDIISRYSCDCPAAENYSGMCKHCVALCFEALEHGYLMPSRKITFSSAGEKRTDYRIAELLEQASRRKQGTEPEGSIQIIPKLVLNPYTISSSGHHITFKTGNEATYVIKHIEHFLDAIRNGDKVTYGKKLSFVHNKNVFSKEAWKYVEFMEDICERYAYSTISRELPVTDRDVARLLMMNLGKSMECDFGKGGRKQQNELMIVDQDPKISIDLEQTGEESYKMTLQPLLFIEGRHDSFVIRGQVCYHLSKEYRERMSDVLRLCDRNLTTFLDIAGKDMHRFVNDVVLDLEKAGAMDTSDLDLSEYKAVPLEIGYYLDENENHVMVKVRATYGEEQFNLLDDGDAVHYRDYTGEANALRMAEGYFPMKERKEGFLYFPADDSDRQYQLMDTGISQFETLGKVYASERFRKKKIIRTPRASVGISVESGLLNLKVDSSEFTTQELNDILESYRQKKRYYRLKSGDFVSLDHTAISSIAELLDGLMLSKKDLKGESITIPKFRAGYIDQILSQETGMLEIDRSPDYKSIIRDMKNVEDSDYIVPKNLHGTLRKYQKMGYRWMRTLGDLGFGGILADDMGLGKTIQTIAYILGRKADVEAMKPCLIVCPASLVYNWEKEIETFAPDLTTKMILGSAPYRRQLIREKEMEGYDADVWITSYDMMKRDVEHYGDISFDTVVIDEAQNIKNPKTLAAKAVKAVNADLHFALTGTPIENRLSELWSIFDFLMPGILGSYPSFRSTFETAIVRDQDEEMMEHLKKMVSPFILRRKKKDVLKELPDKVEQYVYAQMEGEQKKLYTGHAMRLLDSLSGSSQEAFNKGKIEILAEITKLRQICCEPGMLFENYKGESCKIDVCMDLIQGAMDAGNKVLIFSQFTSLFPVLEKRLDKIGAKYYKLTGETPKKQRLEMAETFNENDVPVFLISLKAGGTGLNLTGANIVIHMDPWWNVAAQNQATDRAHRIGQEDVVTVFKIIASDTIEEKIIHLQEQKAELADEVLSGEGISASKLTKEDFMEILV